MLFFLGQHKLWVDVKHISKKTIECLSNPWIFRSLNGWIILNETFFVINAKKTRYKLPNRDNMALRRKHRKNCECCLLSLVIVRYLYYLYYLYYLVPIIQILQKYCKNIDTCKYCHLTYCPAIYFVSVFQQKNIRNITVGMCDMGNWHHVHVARRPINIFKQGRSFNILLSF